MQYLVLGLLKSNNTSTKEFVLLEPKGNILIPIRHLVIQVNKFNKFHKFSFRLMHYYMALQHRKYVFLHKSSENIWRIWEKKIEIYINVKKMKHR